MNGEYKKLLFVIIFNFTEFHKYEIGISYAILKKVCGYLNLKYLLKNKKDPVEIRIVTGSILFIVKKVLCRSLRGLTFPPTMSKEQ